MKVLFLFLELLFSLREEQLLGWRGQVLEFAAWPRSPEIFRSLGALESSMSFPALQATEGQITRQRGVTVLLAAI